MISRYSHQVTNKPIFREQNVTGGPDATRVPHPPDPVAPKPTVKATGKQRRFMASGVNSTPVSESLVRDSQARQWSLDVMAERNRPMSYVAQLDNGRVLKRHVDNPTRYTKKAPPPDMAVTKHVHTHTHKITAPLGRRP